MRFAWILCLIATCTVSPTLAGDSWPEFRGPGGQGHSDATGVPLQWSEDQNVTWKTAIPGEGWSSPVVLGRQIWMTTAEEEGKSLRALCVDLNSGELLHNIELFRVAELAPKHATNSYASPTPVIEPGRVYVHFGTYGTACIDTRTGKPLWKTTELQLDHEVGPGSSPTLYGDLLVINCDGYDVRYVAALHKQTGELAWKKDRPGPLNATKSINKAFSTPLYVQIDGQVQAISPSAQQVVSYNPVTGEEVWRVKYPGFSNVPRPVFGNGLVYVCTGYMTPEIWAIRPNGKGDITQTHVAWKVTKQVPAKPSPLLVGDELYMISDAGIVTCLDARTGEEIWKERFGGNYSASPVFVDGRIYFFGEDGRSVVIAPGRKYEPLATNQLGGRFMASPAIVGKAFILRTHSHLYRIEAK